MRTIIKGTATLALLVGCLTTAQTAVVIQRDFERDLLIGPTPLLQTPGQAVTYISGSVGTGFPGGGEVVQNCLIPVAGCTGPGIPAVLEPDLSVDGVSAQGSAFAGDDSASSSLTVSSGTSNILNPSTRIDVISGDFQQLRFEVAGAGLPEFIEVDIAFSVSASIDDDSNVASGALYFPFASAGVEVLEAATAMFPPAGLPTANAAFSVLATSDTDGTMELLNGVETFLVRPNEDYWLRIITQSDVVLLSAGDYDGLDLSFDTYADPTFSLNPDFAAANPDIASAFAVERTLITVIPLPGALLLLASALTGGGLLRWRWHRAR